MIDHASWIRIGLLVTLGAMLWATAWYSPEGIFDMSATTDSATHTARTPPGFDLQGHRGARGMRPENTWPAFAYALALGIPTLEMDVVVSADGEVVVSHEPWMSPAICTAPDGRPLSENEAQEHNLYQMAYSEIAAYDCGSRAHPSFPDQMPTAAPKPLLPDVLERAEAFVRRTGRDPVFYNIETKSRPEWETVFHPPPDVFAQHLIDVVQQAGVSSRTTIQSFDPRTLRYTREAAPGLRLALLVSQQADSGVSHNVNDLGFVPHIYSPSYKLVTPSMIKQAQSTGMQVIPWTVNSRGDMRRIIEMGADGFITDYPERGQDVLAETETSTDE